METIEYNGHWIDMFHDPHCENPRDNDGSFLFISVAEACLISDAEVDKSFFDGLTTSRRYCEAIANHVDGIYVFPVVGFSRSGQTYFTMYDESQLDAEEIHGFMVYSEFHAAAWGRTFSEQEVWQQMRDELNEYEEWLNGNCWGYNVRTFYGVNLSALFGFVGYDKALNAAKEFIDSQSDTEALQEALTSV